VAEVFEIKPEEIYDMYNKRVFISSRINEMRDFREAALKAIEQAGMQTVFVDSTDPNKRFPLKRGIPLKEQLLEAVKSSDVFVGIYGDTLAPNWIPDGESIHIMELEYETALSARLPCFCYVKETEHGLDMDMIRFRRQLMQLGVEFLSTPKALYEDLLAQLTKLKPSLFISYSSEDQNFVDELYAKLRASGQYVWLNTESIPKGDKWHNKMVEGLNETDILILVLSPDSVKSRWVVQEWRTFLDMQKQVMPILYKE
jgi:hypothetical protein